MVGFASSGVYLSSAQFPSEYVRPSPIEDALESQPTIVALLDAAESGGKSAADALFSALYSELHRLARCELAHQGIPVSLSATTLLHKAYIEIAGRDGTLFPDSNRFMAYAARVMRGLLIDYARNRQAQKRGGKFEFTTLTDQHVETMVDDRQLSLLGEALDQLAEIDASLSEIVDLKFFCGLSLSAIAAMRGISERTAQRQWEKARIYLHRNLQTGWGG
jgi:RNA polymerase sigma factor (TIGR02999 family)